MIEFAFPVVALLFAAFATNDAAYARLCTALRIGWRLWLAAFASCFIAFLVAASRQ